MSDDSKINQTEVPPKTELTEDELAKVTGGGASTTLYHNCLTGKHISSGKIVV